MVQNTSHIGWFLRQVGIQTLASADAICDSTIAEVLFNCIEVDLMESRESYAESKPHDPSESLALLPASTACEPSQVATHLRKRDAAQCSCKVVCACLLHNTLGVAEVDLARSVACGPRPLARQ